MKNNNTGLITVKELLDRLYYCSEYEKVHFTEGIISCGALSKEDVINNNYKQYGDRYVIKFGFMNGDIEIGLYI